jgi:hypothetical protein
VEYNVIEPMPWAPGCAIIFGGSSYDKTVDAVAFKWQTSRGWSRPAGELDKRAFLLAMKVAVRESLITPLEGMTALTEGMKATGHP